MQNEHTEAPKHVPKAQALLCFNALVTMPTSMSREKYKWNHVSVAKSRLILDTMLSERSEGSELYHYNERQWRAVVAWLLYCTYDRPVIFENPDIKETVSRDWERLEMIWINRAKLEKEPYIIYHSVAFFFVTKMSLIIFRGLQKGCPCVQSIKGQPSCKSLYRLYGNPIESLSRVPEGLITIW
jgi:hypothetical protein